MLPPIRVPVPAGTKAAYITAISLFKLMSEASVTWTDGSATFAANFVGPSNSYVLGEKVFNMPVVNAVPIPTEFLVSFNFNDDMTHQHSVSGPNTTIVGPEGCATEVQISGFASSDQAHQTPTTVTIMLDRGLSL